MYRPGEMTFARPHFPADKHRGFARRDLARHIKCALHLCIASFKVRIRIVAEHGLERFDFQFQSPPLRDASCDKFYLGRGERLWQIIRCAKPHGFDSGFH